MKLRTLRIQNVLAIRDATIEFDENGVHHIVGPNNVGKSALVSSINILYNNIPQIEVKEFLRDNTRTFKLEATFYDGSQVTLSRGATDYYSWVINGEEGRLDKTKGKVPDVLRRYFRLYTDTEKTKECINIRLPRDVLTFVDTTKIENDYLLQKALGTEEFLLATQKAEAKKREIVAEQKRLREYIGTEGDKLEVLETNLTSLKQVEVQLEELHQRIEEEYTVFTEIERVVQLAEQLATYDEQIRVITNGIDIERGEQLKQEIELLALTQQAIALHGESERNEQQMLKLQEELEVLGQVKGVVEDFVLVKNVQASAIAYQESQRAVQQQQEVVRQADEAYQQFMRDNKFCPIVMNSLDQRCPFGQDPVA